MVPHTGPSVVTIAITVPGYFWKLEGRSQESGCRNAVKQGGPRVKTILRVLAVTVLLLVIHQWFVMPAACTAPTTGFRVWHR